MPTSKNPKTVDGLMKYMRDDKGIQIHGSSQKRKLRNIGYYHGFKGYRYINQPKNSISYTDFNEILAIYDFDTKLKTLLYPQVMFIETALKNYVLEILLKNANSDSFIDIYTKLLTNYKSLSPVGKTFSSSKDRERCENSYKNALKRRLELRDRIYNVQTKAYSNKNKIAVHYFQKDLNLPIWSIFELISLGEFGHLVSCIEAKTRRDISMSLGIKQSDDTNAMLPQRIIYAIKDLRNAIAHNDVIFDARFKSGNIDKQLSNAVQNATGTSNLNFSTITDYIILVVYILNLFEVPKSDLKKILIEYKKLTAYLRNHISISVFNKIIYTNINNTIQTVLNSL